MVSVVALMKVASRAQVIPAAPANRAARRLGEPRRPASASAAATTTMTATAVIQWWLAGTGWPPCGSPAIRNTARPAQVSRAPFHAPSTICWRSQTRRSTSTMMSSVTSSGWTTETSPLCKARA